ncbi:glycosyltransferase [Bradyrhizobium sp. LB11.1]|uniref:glycosyltransferase family 2 protein n=1 Tax=Bradyrhizobium sp. LB11.1 TaxID=3156326 RepID=UPI00339B7B7A
MNIDVILATRGRPENVRVLLDQLRLQARAPDNVIVVGTEPGDLPRIASVQDDLSVYELISPRPGLTSQRNYGVQAARRTSSPDAWITKIIVFFDDDFRPAADWLQRCEALFAADPQVLAVTGMVIMDGARASFAITEDQASDLLAARPAADQIGHSKWKQGLYGCNMAVRAKIFDRCAFDENLPLYGWLEDTDFSGQIRKFSDIHRASDLIGVHLGSKSGRVSGYKYGYSQISNPLYLARKGTVTLRQCAYFCTRALASNALRSIQEHPMIDYRGRLAGNLAALADLIVGSMHPTKIMSFHS